MFRTIFQHELSYWLRNPIPYVFGIFLFAISFLTMWGMASEAPTGPTAVFQNSYYRLNNMSSLFSMLMIFLLPAIMGVSIFRDYKSRMYTVLYSYPFTKRDYLFAKFGSAFSVVIIVVGMIGLGLLLGTLMPGVKKEVLLPFDVMAYVQLYGVFVIPNMLLFGSVIFAIVVFTRNIYIGFISVILLIVFQGIAGGVFTGVEMQFLGSLFDPLGKTAVKNTLIYWTLEERNHSPIPMSMDIICNRLFWLAISLVTLLYTYRKFEFNQFATNFSKSKKRNTEESVNAFAKVQRISLPIIKTDFSFAKQIKTSWNISSIDFRYIVISWPFIAIVLAGFLLVLFQQHEMNPQDGIALLPTTAKMLRVPMFIFTGIINLLTFLYVGVLIYRGKMNRMDGLIDTVPQPNWVLALSKLLAVLKVQFLLLTIVLFAGMITQSINGYFRFELLHYAFELYILQFVHFIIWAMMAMFVHALFQNMYFSFFILILIPMIILMMPGAGDFLEIPLLKESILHYNAVPGQFVGFDYSDMNGYGTLIPLYLMYKLYWIIGGFTLLIAALICWKRGLTYSLKERWRQIHFRFTGTLRISFLFALLLFLGTGYAIYYQEHFVSKVSYSQADEDNVLALNEKRYARYSSLIQPKITKVNMNMDIYPATLDFKAEGDLYFVNKVDKVIDTILIARSFKDSLVYQIVNAHTVIVKDDEVHFDVVKLSEGLAKGDTLQLKVNVQNFPNSYLHNNDRVLSNGSYIKAHILPQLGVRNAFLTSKKKRKKFGLDQRTIPDQLPSDSSLLGYEFAYNNMDRIDYETRVSTSSDQQAFSMGVLQKKWTENGRNFYHFKSAGKIVNNISWLSAKYEKKENTSPHQHLELYYHEDHHHNIEHFFHGLKSSLDYCSNWFGALEYDTLKLVEFPRSYGTYATIQGNLVPYSEAQFLCNVKDHKNEKFNDPFYTTAHEIAHYWWAHRVDPANVQGGKLLTEAMADYIAIKVTEQQYGYNEARTLRKKYLDTYFQIRAQSNDELPLIHARLEQDYLNYRKGSLALYTLSEHIGEDSLNQALAVFEKENRFSEPPYPSSLDFVKHLSKAVPDSLQYLIKDLFETITIHTNKVENVKLIQVTGGTYQLSISLRLSKHRANGSGKKSYSDNALDSLTYENIHSLPLNDYFQLGIYNEKDEAIKLVDFKATEINESLKIDLDQKPYKLILDPNTLFFDTDLNDNEWIIE